MKLWLLQWRNIMQKVNRYGFMRIQLPNGKSTYAPLDENNKPIKVECINYVDYERLSEELKRLGTSEEEIYQIAMERYNERHDNS